MERLIFHIDLNAFYATAEAIKDSSLLGLPLVVAGSSKRSVITTASYEARAFGIRSGMPVMQALTLCPDLVSVPIDMAFYQKLSTDFVSFLNQYTPLVEQASIDECYLDMSSYLSEKRPLDLAFIIQKELMETLELKASIGISYNKFLAKMASDMIKPLGISIIRENEIKQKIWPIPIEKMHGIGKATAPKLRKLKIETIGDLASYQNITSLRKHLGKNTQAFIDNANGVGESIINVDQEIKSLSQSSTFAEDVTDYVVITELFAKQAKKLAKRLEKHNLLTNNITITLRYNDFNTINKSKTLNHFISESSDIISEALLLFDSNYTGQPLRLIGISLANLKYENEAISQLSLF